MRRHMSRLLLFPAILFLGAGLVSGGADLPRIWGLVALGLPLGLLILQFLRPTQSGWRLAFGSFCLLALGTAAYDLSVAVPRGLPSLSASTAMVVLFAAQFGVPAWLLWLSRPRGDQGQGSIRAPHSSPADNTRNGGSSCKTGDRVGIPPNYPLQATAGVGSTLVSSRAFTRGA